MKIGVANQFDKRLSAAFTITEVVISVGIFAIAFLAAYAGIMQGYNIIQITRENERATQILQDKAEVLRLYTWNELTNLNFTSLTFSDSYNPAAQTQTNGNLGPAYSGTVTISNAPFAETYAGDVKVLIFQVTWTNNDIAHQRQLTTLVSRYGMHNYIYGPTN